MAHHEDERELAELLELRPVGSVQRVALYFSRFREAGSPPPADFVLELERQGFEAVADEELTGDGFWHVAAFRREPVDESHLRRVLREAQALAISNGAQYDGWTWRTTVAEQRQHRSPDPEQ